MPDENIEDTLNLTTKMIQQCVHSSKMLLQLTN